MRDLSEAMHAIERGMRLAKCRKCGCMQSALTAAADVAAGDTADRIAAYRVCMEPIAYACFGCRRCWGAEAQNALESEPEAGDCCTAHKAVPTGASWPVVPGEYLLGDPDGHVAVCTLGSAELAAPVMELARAYVAIAGPCETENIGIERLVLNAISNPLLRSLVLCGKEVKGHRPGDALLCLDEHGADPELRIVRAAGQRPALPNLTLRQVARFREQVEVVDLVGETDPDRIARAAQEREALGLSPLPPFDEWRPSVVALAARAPRRLTLDPGGFLVILPDRARDVIVCEHYLNDGRLVHAVEGIDAARLAATIVEEGWVTQLDHAAYLGRELQKAQFALECGFRYVQDGAMGEIEETTAPLASPLVGRCKRWSTEASQRASGPTARSP